MENASKALIMAGSVLIGVLILTLMVTLFLNARTVSNEYEQNKKSEAIQQFNVNFIKYLGQDLTIHQVVTICNFASESGVTIIGKKTKDDIIGDEEKYILTINSYSEEGYVNSISFSKTK